MQVRERRHRDTAMPRDCLALISLSRLYSARGRGEPRPIPQTWLVACVSETSLCSLGFRTAWRTLAPFFARSAPSETAHLGTGL